MKAAVLHEPDFKLTLADVPEPEIQPGQVRIRVSYCGVCGSDVHLVLHRTLKAAFYPIIPGHESAGLVDAVGPGVTGFKKGDRVIIGAGTSCGQCQHCKIGQENLCPDVGVLGFDANGSYSELVVVPERSVYHLPEDIPLEHGAILADCVSTPYHATNYAGELKAGESVAVFGCGGLGIHAILISRALGAEKVYAFDVDPGALEHADRFGADEVFDVRKVRSPGRLLEERGGVDLVMDFSGYYANITKTLRALRTGGRAVLVGIGKNKMDVPIPALIVYRQLSIRGSYGSDRRAIPDLIELLRSRKLDLEKSITSIHPLAEVNDCLQALERREGNPIRYVIQP